MSVSHRSRPSAACRRRLVEWARRRCWSAVGWRASKAELGAPVPHDAVLSSTPEGEAPFCLTPSPSSKLEIPWSRSRRGSGLSGVLKITAPNVIGHSVVVPVVAELIADNPALRVDLTLSDGIVDIATAGLDVAIRVATMKPSDMIATRVADNPFIVIASPGYVACFGTPATTEDLVSHPCIKLHAMDAWPFRRGGEMHRVRISGPLSANTVDAVRAACIAGVGIAMLTFWDVHKQIASGELQRIVLSDVEPLEVGIWAVFPTQNAAGAGLYRCAARSMLAGISHASIGTSGTSLKYSQAPLIRRRGWLRPPRARDRSR